jgi:uncharacterized protein YjbI with pentapeptide repeats
MTIVSTTPTPINQTTPQPLRFGNWQQDLANLGLGAAMVQSARLIADRAKEQQDRRSTAAVQKRALEEAEQFAAVMEDLKGAKNFFTRAQKRRKKPDPIEAQKWADKVKTAWYWLYEHRLLSGELDSYAASDKGLAFPGIPLNGFAMEAEKPKGLGWIYLKFWLSAESKRQLYIKESARRTLKRKTAQTQKEIEDLNKKYPPRNQGNFINLQIPFAQISDFLLKGGRLHGANLSHIVANQMRIIDCGARKLNLKKANLKFSELSKNRLAAAIMDNLQVTGATITGNRFGPSVKRNMPAASMQKLKVINTYKPYPNSPALHITSNFANNDFTQVNNSHSDYGIETNLSGCLFDQTNVTGNRYVAPNLTKTQWKDVIGFETTEMTAMRNKQPFKTPWPLQLAQKTGVLRLLKQAARAEVNPHWRNTVQTPLASLVLAAKKRNALKPVQMQQASIQNLNMANKDITQFNFAKARAAGADFTQAKVGNVPMANYLEKIDKLKQKGKVCPTLLWYKKQLPAFNNVKSAPLLSKNPVIQKTLVETITKI